MILFQNLAERRAFLLRQPFPALHGVHHHRRQVVGGTFSQGDQHVEGQYTQSQQLKSDRDQRNGGQGSTKQAVKSKQPHHSPLRENR